MATKKLICETCNKIHIYIYEYISTYRPTFFLNSIRESKDQIDMALVLKEEAASFKIKGLLYSCLLILRLPSGSRILTLGNHLDHLLSNNLDTGQKCMPKRSMKFWSLQ